jgi:hypothetical protein
MNKKINIVTKSKKTKLMLIQIGERTHHQDHVITLQSLRVIKTIVRRPTNPIPPDDEVLLLLIVVLFKLIKRFISIHCNHKERESDPNETIQRF